MVITYALVNNPSVLVKETVGPCKPRINPPEGPNEVSIFNPEAVPILLGPGSKCTKAPWYDANDPVISLHTLRDKAAHDARRRIWDRGFGAKGCRLKLLK
jgi:hypothetical protein